MRHEHSSVIDPDPVAFFLTWTTYGSWLPGDARGWVGRHGAIGTPSNSLARSAGRLLRTAPVVLGTAQRRTVETTLREQCAFYAWRLHAVACRTSHVHVVVSAPDRDPTDVLRSLKAWSSRRLSEAGAKRTVPWWTKSGSVRRIYGMDGVSRVVEYVLECQDVPRRRK
jgi:REP element-mobilizing transposase RayT